MLWSDDVCHDCIGAHYQSLARVLPAAAAGMADNLPLRNKGCFGFLPLERLKLERRQFAQIPDLGQTNRLVQWEKTNRKRDPNHDKTVILLSTELRFNL